MAFSCRLRLDWAVDKIEGGDCDVSGSIIGIGLIGLVYDGLRALGILIMLFAIYWMFS